MSQPFLGEVRMVGFNFAPRGWAFCDGQLLPINQNQSLYSLFGTTYGGDGRTSFALPELRGRTPIHKGDGHSQGQKSGAETHLLTAQETPAHAHNPVRCNNAEGNLKGPTTSVPNIYWAAFSSGTQYSDSPDNTMLSAAMGNVGGAAHENMQPYLTVNFCVALQGLFPSRN
jgi:microcystin-dependent protein